MGATFPNGIASFKTHRDLLDDVEAADINKIQDELLAVEAALGSALTTIQEVAGEVDVLQSEIESNTAQDQSLLLKFQSLKDLLSYMWEGKNIYAAMAEGFNIKLPKTPKDRPYPPNLVQLRTPSSDDDPMGMWNGTGFTLKKTGLWMLHGEAQINLGQAAGNNNFGTYEASITIDGQHWLRGLDRQYPQVDGMWHDLNLLPMIVGWFPQGTRVTLRAAQSSSLDQSIYQSRLSIFRVRGRA